MSPRILDGALPLAERELGRLRDDDRTLCLRAIVLSFNVDHSHDGGVRKHRRVGCATVPAGVGDDHRAVANRQLRAVIFTDSNTLNEAE